MISTSIKQFRAQRSAKSKYSTSGKGSDTEERMGLARRKIAKSAYESDQEAAQYAESQNDPGEKVNSWADGIASLRAERAASDTEIPTGLGSYSSTGEAPTLRPKSQILDLGKEGRLAAEEYLGKPIEQTEWEMLARATYAESSNNPEEMAAVMTVMLNRVNSKGFPNSIKAVLNQKNAFQAVTGTKDNPGPSERFLAFNDKNMSAFEKESSPLLTSFSVDNWLNFTAHNKKAYGPGTDIEFRESVNSAKGSRVIGGTIFGTVRN